MQMPALRHGFDKHSLIASLHCIPVQPGSQTQVQMLGVATVHVPNEHGLLLHGLVVSSHRVPKNNIEHQLIISIEK